MAAELMTKILNSIENDGGTDFVDEADEEATDSDEEEDSDNEDFEEDEE